MDNSKGDPQGMKESKDEAIKFFHGPQECSELENIKGMKIQVDKLKEALLQVFLTLQEEMIKRKKAEMLLHNFDSHPQCSSVLMYNNKRVITKE